MAGGESLSLVPRLELEVTEERSHLQDVSERSLEAVVGAESVGESLEATAGEFRAMALVRKSV